jgi:hypothetical protein
VGGWGQHGLSGMAKKICPVSPSCWPRERGVVLRRCGIPANDLGTDGKTDEEIGGRKVRPFN